MTQLTIHLSDYYLTQLYAIREAYHDATGFYVDESSIIAACIDFFVTKDEKVN